jgi:hypothetical protein
MLIVLLGPAHTASVSVAPPPIAVKAIESCAPSSRRLRDAARRDTTAARKRGETFRCKMTEL